MYKVNYCQNNILSVWLDACTMLLSYKLSEAKGEIALTNNTELL